MGLCPNDKLELGLELATFCPGSLEPFYIVSYFTYGSRLLGHIVYIM